MDSSLEGYSRGHLLLILVSNHQMFILEVLTVYC